MHIQQEKVVCKFLFELPNGRSAEDFVILTAEFNGLLVNVGFIVFCHLYAPTNLGQDLAPFPQIMDGCQWVLEPVSRHFFINQDSF
ncbi:hypothetical protein SAMN05661044_00519 [Olivibacter domesticus]|uniref:Uncharacterized protein n=1 Tax=Olivibacter domesticus TaxID=407022 RepID=A0A1H7I3G6_OLID1|nr:hypothetical protein SAMN05661044_00519 [Olivibacter domesticus]